MSSKVLIIAEIGNNHEGSYAKAEAMIGAAQSAGVDGVKFQTYRTDHFINLKNEARVKQLNRFALSHSEFEKLHHYAKKNNLLFISTPLDLESAQFLSPIVDAFKIASSDNTFYPLIQYVATTQKPILLSTGLTDIDHLTRAVSLIESTWEPLIHRPHLTLLHCVAAYPVPDNESNLSLIPTLKDAFPNHTIGYSDHVLGIESAVLSVAAGARVIEKHFTLDKTFSSFRDHAISADPDEMKALVAGVRSAERRLGNGAMIQRSETPNVAQLRRSIAAKTNLSAGSVITWHHLIWTRPAGGLAPGNEAKIIGRKLSRSIRKGEWITTDDVM